jgi:hypothetical protein
VILTNRLLLLCIPQGGEVISFEGGKTYSKMFLLDGFFFKMLGDAKILSFIQEIPEKLT